MMKASGVITDISNLFLSLSNSTTFPVLAYFSAGLVNMFVPSGGGQFAIQAEILLEAGKSLGVAPAKTILAFSLGDAWTNMLQPFWALPLLGIMGLRAKDVIAYTSLVFLLMLFFVPLILLIF